LFFAGDFCRVAPLAREGLDSTTVEVGRMALAVYDISHHTNNKEIPMILAPYLFFNGDCEAAFKFYAQCTHGKIDDMMKHEGTPAAKDVPQDWLGKILHARMTIGGQVLMASDAPPAHYQKPQGFSLSLHTTDVAEAERTFQALSEGGQVTMPMQKTFWATLFGTLVDRFGVPWMINCGENGQQ
jgi:PhnB protein